jgi:polysaccharide biosynthesis/export protein
MRYVRLMLLAIVASVASGCISILPPDGVLVPGGPYGTPIALIPEGVANPAYTLDSGDRLRVVVFGQDGLSNSYTVDPAGNITLPLIGPVAARGRTTTQVSATLVARLRQGFLREPHVAVEVEFYRPFFILGEVTFPGQYPYVVNMTAETAVAIAGGFTPRAFRYNVEVSRLTDGTLVRETVPLTARLRPGDTVVVAERWF